MTQQNLLELAKQGNPKAIEALINRQLQSKGIAAKTVLKNDSLQIVLESTQVPDQQALVAFLRKSMTSLGAKSIKRVKVYGKKTSEQISVWHQEFELGEKPLVNKPVTFNSSTASNDQQTNIKELAKNGNIEAITTLLNRATQLKGITTTATLQDDCLQVIIESDQAPDEEASMRLLHRELTSLKVKIIKTVKVSGKQTREELPAWSQEFNLVAQKTVTSPSVSSLHSNSRIEKSQNVISILIKFLTKKIVLPRILRSSKISIQIWKLVGFLGSFVLILIVPERPIWLILINMVFCGTITGEIAQQKQLSFFEYFLLGFLLNILAIMLILDSPNKELKDELEAQTKKAQTDWQEAQVRSQKDFLKTKDLLATDEKIVFQQSSSYRGGILGHPQKATETGLAFVLSHSFVFQDKNISWKIPYERITEAKLDFFQMGGFRGFLASGDVGRQLQSTKNTLEISYFGDDNTERSAKFQIHGALTIYGEEEKANEFLNYLLEFKGQFASKSGSNNESDPLSRLEKLKYLKDKGVITESEFEAKKRELLDQL